MARIDVAKQLHDDWEADAGAKHFRGAGVAELMGDDICGQSESVADATPPKTVLVKLIHHFFNCLRAPIA